MSTLSPRILRALPTLILVLVAAVLALPVLAVVGSWLQWNGVSAQILREMAATVLPEYLAVTVQLSVLVGLGVVAMGVPAAVLVTVFDFPGRRSFEWLLLLPLAMPAYVTAYAYTDFLQFAGPLQTWMRASFGLEGRLLPEVRSLGGAAWVFSFSLYPYVYLLARTALAERAPQLMEAARLLGAGLPRRLGEVALPMARPAVAAGTALALMEVLADYGVSAYFGIQTFTVGIYKAWLSMGDRVAAAQLATVMLGLVVLLLWLEQHARRRLRFAGGTARASSSEARPIALRGARSLVAWVLCLMPVLMGFVLPVAFMLRPLAADWSVLPWDRFLGWAWNSVRLGAMTAVLAVLAAWFLAYCLRRQPSWPRRLAVQTVSLGYAVPGAVVVVGLLLPVGWLQARWPQAGAGGLVTATVLGLLWAYLVRFVSVALQSMQAGYARVPRSLDESARMLGAGGLELAARVHAPLLRRAGFAAALLVFVDVMKELPATIVLRPFNTDTLAVVANQLARDERLGEAALPSLALVVVGLLPVILLSRTLRAERRPAEGDLGV
ncbi:iron ABC transporter permease [Ottowia sp.]|uniref:ABC transporter permease n=1 Tax=Ottowia sp. TaxID=1898956 RepID=UPI0025DCA532|nr:iron ABC transporter permease [Ottowia sp.]MBK6614222.1 iron ABC transporter permease [Ottowia sp.]MBK6745219.1 iron ABC transporter permease [Ottowia sp.]